MASDNSPDYIARPGSGGKPEGASAQASDALQKFRALPPKMQGAILIAVLIVVFYVISSLRGGGAPSQRNVVNLGQANGRNGEVSATFAGIETDRPAVMQAVFEQNRRDMAELRSKIESDFGIRDKALQDAITQNQELQRQMQQMMGDFTTELKSIQVERARDNERLVQLADQQRQLEMNAPVNGVGQVGGISPQRRAIQQVVLGGGGGVMGAVRGPFAQAGTGANQQANGGQAVRNPAEKAAEERLPFIPPLGFVRATMLNGVDALVGGSTTPALARLSGTYKTAMNSTISLDGCIAMVEFSGNISTERATGKPVRMTCVYPDGGAATYQLSGYAVDAEDGIIGVPGVLYEGDPSRIAAAMLAEFAAGVAGIVEDNTGSSVTTVNNEGTASTIKLPSSADWAEQIIGGSGKVMGSLRDYLQKRADRVQSFIRLDATREINLVILNGTELRKSGEVWSALFDGNSDSGLPQSNLPAAASGTSE